jgi:hypothetical protein
LAEARGFQTGVFMKFGRKNRLISR